MKIAWRCRVVRGDGAGTWLTRRRSRVRKERRYRGRRCGSRDTGVHIRFSRCVPRQNRRTSGRRFVRKHFSIHTSWEITFDDGCLYLSCSASSLRWEYRPLCPNGIVSCAIVTVSQGESLIYNFTNRVSTRSAGEFRSLAELEFSIVHDDKKKKENKKNEPLLEQRKRKQK